MHPQKLRPTLALGAALAFAAAPGFAASDLGKLDFPTSAPPAAQEHFVRGVAALHNFWYDEAADEFRAAEKAEPGFALAYWGEAMTFNHPIWSEEDLAGARAALAKLAPAPRERAAKAPTEREKAWLGAVEALYAEGEKPARDRAYSAAMARIHERWPDDVEAGSFYALSLIGPALVTNGATFGEPRERVLMRAAAILEELFARNPQHPGVVHYMIHAYDDPVHAPLGLRAARAYAQVAPAAYHALHMPSHIFVQLGRWSDVAASNEASWAASVAWTERRKLPIEKRDFHSLSWLSYAYLQQGRYGKARETLDLARKAAEESPGSARISGALEGMEARYLIETRSWEGAKMPAVAVVAQKTETAGKGSAPAAGAHCQSPAAAAPGGDHGSGIFAAGLAAARRGDTATADEAVARLRALSKDGPKGVRGYGSDPAAMTVMEKEIAGLSLLAKGRKDEGLALLAEAAKMEDAMTPPSGPPELLKPAQELYGEALLEQGKPEEAAAQLHRSLQRMPERTASLLGAARAAARLGHEDEARRLYADLAEIWGQADSGLPEVAEARSHLTAAPAR
jgi:tetratricopeptide (TPR) repeat protein